jgi:nitrate/nitrite-specific signal transduction histidine kinase
MDETTQSELEKIFRGYENKIKERTREYEEQKQELERLQGEYNRVKSDVIKPKMEEVGSYIKKLGHDYRITESEEEITMVVIP